jgi:hypothetical protein
MRKLTTRKPVLELLEDRTMPVLLPVGAFPGYAAFPPQKARGAVRVDVTFDPNTMTAGQLSETFESLAYWNTLTFQKGKGKGKPGKGMFFAYTADASQAEITLDFFEAPGKILGFAELVVFPNFRPDRPAIIAHAHISLNRFFDFSAEPVLTFPMTQVDYRSVVIHELGHAIGLGHNDTLYDQLNGTGFSVMATFYQFSSGHAQRSASFGEVGTILGADATGVRFLYKQRTGAASEIPRGEEPIVVREEYPLAA